MRLLSRAETLARIGIPRSTWYWLRNRGEFPEPVHLGPRAVGWRSDVVDSWLKQHGMRARVHRDP